MTTKTDYIFNEDYYVWEKPGREAFAYSDGDEVENRIHQIIANAQDTSGGAPELVAQINDWATEYHFTPARHNLLRPFNFEGKKILELGSGCGAITRQLGESGAAQVCAVEGSLRRARITAERCRDLPNVTVYCDNLVEFDSDEKFDIVTLIGVMEYSRAFIAGSDPELSCLKKALGHLKKDGCLILAIENQLGLKYFNGAGEDHVGTPFFGINDLYDKKTVATFGKRELSNLLTDAGFQHLEFYYPFPDYKIPNLILSEEALDSPELNLGNLLLRANARDYTGRDLRSFNEGLTWRALARNHLIAELSNSFLVFAYPHKETAQPAQWLTKYYNTGRLKCWMKESTIRKANNYLEVDQNFIYPNAEKLESDIFSPNLAPKEKYIDGTLYLTGLIENTTRGCDLGVMVAWVKPWLDFLIEHVSEKEKGENVLLSKLPGNYIDCIPHNLIQDKNGNLHYFDDEWQSHEAIPLAWILIRGLAYSLTNVIVTPLTKNITYQNFIQQILTALNLTFNPEEVFTLAITWENKLHNFTQGSTSSQAEFSTLLNREMSGFIPVEELKNENIALEWQVRKFKLNTQKERVQNLLARTKHSLPIIKQKTIVFLKKIYRILPLPTFVKTHIRDTYYKYKHPSINKDTNLFSSLNLPSLSTSNLPDIFIWGVIDWHFRFQRPQHLAKNFAEKGHRVFYFSNEFVVNKATEFKLEKPYNHLELYIIYLHIPKHISIYTDHTTKMIVLKLKAELISCLSWTQSSQIYSIIQHPFWYNCAKNLPNQIMIYDCMDHHGGFEDNSKNILALEEILIKNADLLLVSSQWLKDNLSPKNPHLALIRNACDYHHFSKCPIETYQDPQKRKIIGYYGAIAEWFDLELVEKIALTFSDCLILLIGADTINAHHTLKKYSNILMTGEASYDKLPYYLYAFDVCFIPFKVIPLTLATNPVKAYEFLSAGKTIVSVDLPELHEFENLISLAADHDQFIQQLKTALDHPSSIEQKAQRRAFAQTQTWNKRVNAIETAIATEAKPLISIIILTYNNLSFTQACLESVEKFTDYANYEVILVDNASTDGTPEYLVEYCKDRPNYQLILNENNLGFAAGNNIGLRAAQGDYLVILNNDTYVTQGWLSTLVRHFKKDPTLGILGPVTNNIGNEAKINIHYSNMSEMAEKARHYTLHHMGESFPMRTAAFFCVMISREAYSKIGDLDEAFGVGMFEDDDYCQRAHQLGFKIACADDVFIHHHLSASFDKMGAQRKQALFEKNKAIFEQKWGKWEPHQYR